jgi:uncharacterized repeat protein (TIGR03843 family)
VSDAENSTPLDDLLDATIAATDSDAADLLRRGEIEVHGRMPWSSNRTFLSSVADGEVRAQAIYKPEAGERPLWDFPSGLWKREIAAYELSEALGWHVVPPTVQRSDAPLGEGSLQFFVPSDYEAHYFTIRDQHQHRSRLERICILDIIANNTDRKAGHCLVGDDDLIWAIDNGLSFHAEFKVRTVLWDYGGDPLPVDIVDDVCALVERGLPDVFVELLDPFERDAMLTRARAVVAAGQFPEDPTGQRYPWPLV